MDDNTVLKIIKIEYNIVLKISLHHFSESKSTIVDTLFSKEKEASIENYRSRTRLNFNHSKK